jgi:hypothetical protein
VALAAILVLIAVQIVFSIPNGLKAARSNYVYQAESAKVLRNIHHATNQEVQSYLYIFTPVPFIKSRAATLEKHHLSLFANVAPNP